MLGPYRGEPDWQSGPWPEDENEDIGYESGYSHPVWEYTDSSQTSPDQPVVGLLVVSVITTAVSYLLYQLLQSANQSYIHALSLPMYEGSGRGDILCLGPAILFLGVLFLCSAVVTLFLTTGLLISLVNILWKEIYK